MLSLANSMMRFKVLSFGAECFDGVVCGIGDACVYVDKAIEERLRFLLCFQLLVYP